MADDYDVMDICTSKNRLKASLNRRIISSVRSFS